MELVWVAQRNLTDAKGKPIAGGEVVPGVSAWGSFKALVNRALIAAMLRDADGALHPPRYRAKHVLTDAKGKRYAAGDVVPDVRDWPTFAALLRREMIVLDDRPEQQPARDRQQQRRRH